MTISDAAADRWLTCPVPRRAARARLFCLPHAGAGASAYDGWPDMLAEHTDVEVLPVRPPGRESRLAERPRLDSSELTDAIERRLDRPYALFGHSVGARLAFEVVRELRRRGRPRPVLLCVSGCPAPQLPVESPEDSSLCDDAFLERVAGIGGMPAHVLADPELRELVLPALRADFDYVDSYRYEPEPPLPVLLHAFGGDDDPEAGPGKVQAWRSQSIGPFRCTILRGDHFFVTEHRDEVIRQVAGSLEGALETSLGLASEAGSAFEAHRA
ncbi:thioesterase II family protein [Solicola gregarius]|uniref:Thioesterase domain-containing protein n=1 Tax=Solicola gregarius TaxID=2908642 RepID=A0AA46TE40_9ACTN|nr:thioesterase domain-containing protein [Solicola gregarius]UYM03652.1 thioesterase domain-containing protein [Solicola gregarius]